MAAKRPSEREDQSRRRRVLAFADFVQEIKAGEKFTADDRIGKYGAAIPAIPVPLFADESEVEYEREFQSWFAKRTEKGPMVSERALRFTFATARAEWYTHESPYRQLYTGRDPEHVTVDELPRAALYVEKVVDYGLYRQQVKYGFFRRLSMMTHTQIFNRFGSIVAPIFVPLKVKETVEGYERRFRRWLEATKHTTVMRLKSHPDREKERDYRVKFAEICGTGVEKSATIPKRPRSPTKPNSSEPGRKRLKASSERTEEARSRESTTAEQRPEIIIDQGEETEDEEIKLEETVPPPAIAVKICPGLNTIDECVACGCPNCFDSGKSLLRQQEAGLERARLRFREHPLWIGGSSSLSLGSAVSAVRDLVLFRPTTADLHASISHRLTPSASECIEPISDPVQTKLEHDYETLNDQIVMNEKVLDAAVARLALTPVVDIQKTSQLHAEHEEMRQLIQHEVPDRDAALSVLIVYLWRHEVEELEAIASDPTATNVRHVHRASHHKCALLSAEITKLRQLAEDLKGELDTTMADGSWDDPETLSKLDTLGARLVTIESDITRLHGRRKDEFVKLVHFDEHVRLLVQELLVRAAPPRSSQGIDSDSM